MHPKNFDGWNVLKKSIEDKKKNTVFKQREIWWCNFGINIGSEIDGKNQPCSRPVLILRKFNQSMFLGVPLSTKIKDNPYYKKIDFQKKEQSVIISQLRLLDSKRLYKRMGNLTDEQFNYIRRSIKNII